MHGNNRDSIILNSNDQIAQVADPAEQNSSDQPARIEIPSNDKPVEPIANEILPNAPLADDHSIPGDKHEGTAVGQGDRNNNLPSTLKKELKPDIDEGPKTKQPHLLSETPDKDNPTSITLNSPIPKNVPGSKDKPGFSSSFPASSITLNLPSGNIFNSRLFDVDLKSVEDNLENELKRQLKEQDVNGKVFLVRSPNSTTQTLGVHDKGRLDGVFLSLYNDDSPFIYANYTDGMLHGILKKWNENGQRVYWCQYVKGRRHGFCCYFKDDILRIIYEINFDNINAVHLCSNSDLVKSFESFEQAIADNNAKMLIDEVNMVESELKNLEIAYKKEIKDEFQRFRELIARKKSQEYRDNIQKRINQRNFERQKQIDTLRHKGGL